MGGASASMSTGRSTAPSTAAGPTSSCGRLTETSTSGNAEAQLDLTNVPPRDADVAALQAADHREIEHVTLERQDDVFPRPIIVFAAKARPNLLVVHAVPHRLQMVVRRSDQQVFEVIGATLIFNGGPDAFETHYDDLAWH